MDGIGPDAKRLRLRYDPPPPPRMPTQQHQPPTPSQLHTNSTGILPVPATYVPQSQPPPPPSPYDVSYEQQRSLPDPTPHGYVQTHSGQSTPRDTRFHNDIGYSRRGSTSATPRSPDDLLQYPTRIANTGDGPQYPQYAVDHHGQPPGYPAQDPSLTGNIQHGLPMHSYNDQGHGIPSGHHVDYSQSPVTAGPQSYTPVGFGPPIGQPGMRPKKGNRATQACDVCRTRKAKCDEGRPRCMFCVENDMQCNYQSVAPAKVDRANLQIQEEIKALRKELKADFAGRFDRIEQLLSATINSTRVPPKSAPEGQDVKPSPSQLESPGKAPAAVQKAAWSTVPLSQVNNEQKESPSGSFNTNDNGSTGSDPVATQDSSYTEHYNTAHNLLSWPQIGALLQKSKKLDFNERFGDYVMNYETNKGVLRVYGRGQGRDTKDGSHAYSGVASPANSVVSIPSDDASEARSPASTPEDLWGTGLTPLSTEPRIVSDVGGLNPDGSLKLDSKSIETYLKSYYSNIHKLHPFLDERKLDSMFEQFKRRHNPGLDQNAFRPSFTVSNDFPSGTYRVPKRKHSGEQHSIGGPDAGPVSNIANARVPVDRSPSTAIVLLVMALGRICEERRPLPAPVPETARENSSAPPRAYSPLGMQTDSPPSNIVRKSPSSQSQSTAHTSVPSPLSMGRVNVPSPRSSVRDSSSGARNVNRIPGLAYYAKATDILGNINGYNDLAYVQACLVAGLYAGQLANTIESLYWIQAACRTCRFLVRDPSLKKEREPRKDLIRFAFWTCMQLEGDILAEFSEMPKSGIKEVQGDVEYPKGVVVFTDKEKIMQYYSAQMQIRSLLDDIQSELYQKPDFKRATQATSLRDHFDTALNSWRALLPDYMTWEDGHYLEDDINDARLRGKFYGAQYIIHRPFLHLALELESKGQLTAEMLHIRSGPHIKGPPRTPVSLDSPVEAMPPPKKTKLDLDYYDHVMTSARICIGAAIRSTQAFDHVLDHRRLIVTNIMGTAHAQFGNMLVLSAVHKSKFLQQYVEKRDMEHLFDRTIKFLSRLEPISKTLGHDCFILKCLREVVFDGTEEQPTASTSVSSH